MSYHSIRNAILKPIDWFYPPFRNVIGIQTFRYGVCGGSNAVLNLAVFHLSYHFIFSHELIAVGPILITRYIAAYCIALCVSFPIGFLLNRYIVFQQSNLQGKTQLMRYGSLTIMNISLEWVLLHLFVGYFNFHATVSQAAIIVMLSLISYFYQTYFSFKTVRDSESQKG